MIRIAGVTFYLYGLLIGLAVWSAYEAARLLARQKRLDEKQVERLFWWAIVGGFVGARLYHVADWWSEYAQNPIQIIKVWQGGLGIWGAVIGGLGAVITAIKLGQVRLKLVEAFDLIAVSLPLGQAVGRWGNFFNGEIVGKNGEPLFLYESLLNLILFGLIYRGRLRFKNRLLGLYLVGYGTIRLILENWRQSVDQWLLGGWSMASILAIVVIVTGLVLIFAKSVRQGRVPRFRD